MHISIATCVHTDESVSRIKRVGTDRSVSRIEWVNVPVEQAEEALLVRDDSVESDEATARPSSVNKQHVLLKFLNLFLDCAS